MNPSAPPPSPCRLRTGVGTTALLFAALAACDGGPTAPTVQAIQITGPTTALVVGETLQLSAAAVDSNGDPVAGQTIVWSSEAQAIATVDQTGRVTGVAPGNAVIRASTGTINATRTVQVAAATPTISAIVPALLEEGGPATLTGERFAGSPAANVVRIGGVRAEVLGASATSLEVRVPQGVCSPPGGVAVTVTVAGSSSPEFAHPMQSPPPIEVPVGELRRIAAPDHLCLHLAAAAGSETYLIGVQAATDNPMGGSATPVAFRARTGTGAGVVAAGAAGRLEVETAVQGAAPGRPTSRGLTFREALTPRITAAAFRDARPHVPERWARHRQAEAELRRLDERARALHGAMRAAPRRAAAGAPAAAVAADVEVGDTIELGVPDIPSGNICQNARAITAVVRRVGTGSVWLEDVANPEGGFTSGDFADLSALFDEETLSELSDYFGEPTDIDGNGRIVVVVTEKVNRMSFALGFVASTDFFPAQCPASNGGEFYYARAPDPDGSIPGPDGTTPFEYPVADARADAPVLLAHEVTHVIQFGRRFQQGLNTATRWELEGQATFAEEVVGYRITGLAPRQNHGFDVAFNSGPGSSSLHPNDWFLVAFVDLAVYYGFRSPSQRSPGAPEECGWLEQDVTPGQFSGPCSHGRLPYGVPWSFLRWLSDHLGDNFPGGERELHRRLVDDHRRGFATLAGVLGEPVAPLLARWAASLYADGRLTGGDPRLAFPSWDLRGIEDRLVPTAHLEPRQRAFSPFEDAIRLAPGSTAYYRVSGSARSATTFRARTPDGGALPAHVQLWVVRLQ